MARYGILLSKHADCNDTNNSCQVGTIPRCDAAGYCTLDGELTCVNETCTRDGYYLYYVARIATSRQVLLWTKLPANHPGMNSTIIFEHLSSINSHFSFSGCRIDWNRGFQCTVPRCYRKSFACRCSSNISAAQSITACSTCSLLCRGHWHPSAWLYGCGIFLLPNLSISWFTPLTRQINRL
jgi:hypothetical protein